MPRARAYSSEDRRLRIVFDRKVLSLGIGVGATFGDVARKVQAIRRKKYGNPLAIDVTVPHRPAVGGLEPARS